jgi:hypothetical protein
VPIVKIALVALALLTVVGQYLQEMHRLSVIRRLPGAQARDYYERTRQRSERAMAVVTALLAMGAAAAMVYTFVIRS